MEICVSHFVLFSFKRDSNTFFSLFVLSFALACGMLVPKSETKNQPPALGAEVLTPGPPGFVPLILFQ